MSPIALVIGDVMLDRRTEGEMCSISREAPAPVIRLTSQIDSLGGAGNVARNIKALGHAVMLMGRVGNDAAGDTVIRLASEAGIDTCLPKRDDHPTIIKHRITCGGQIICRIDTERVDHVQFTDLMAGLQSIPPELAVTIKVIVIADYAKGTLGQDLVRSIFGFAGEFSIPVFVDARPETTGMYVGASLLKPNLQEALSILDTSVHPGLIHGDPVQQCAVACQLLHARRLAGVVLVTNGRHGCCYTDPDDNFAVHTYDAVGQHDIDSVKDICGAGDTTMAALAAASLEGKSFSAAVNFAMTAAGYTVQFYGVHAAERDAVDEFAYQQGNWANKLMSNEQLLEFVARRRRMRPSDQIVFTNGCFDGFHAGHLELLRFAKQQGQVPIVAYNDDQSLVALKGPDRPHVPESFRGSHLALQDVVDAVVRFNGDAEYLVRQIKPDILVKGADARHAPIPGADYVAQHGGQLKLCPIEQFAINLDRARRTKPT